MRSIRRGKVVLWLIGGLLFLILLNVIGQGLSTLDRLAFVEHERDQWQRASAVVAQLNLRDGSRVADLGCGAGYFALKLSAVVGASGNVQAVDILRLPLTFLWIRAHRAGFHNMNVVRAEPDNPHISAPVDAVLIANTYHELSRPAVVLAHLHDALVGGGRVVIADRAPRENTEHAVDPATVETELRRDGFDIVSRDDHFLDQPDEGPWFLIVAVPIMRHKS